VVDGKGSHLSFVGSFHSSLFLDTLGGFFGHELSFVHHSGMLVLLFVKSHFGFVFEILSGLCLVHGGLFSLVFGLKGFHSHSALIGFEMGAVSSSLGMSELNVECSGSLLFLELKLSEVDHLSVLHLLLFHEHSLLLGNFGEFGFMLGLLFGSDGFLVGHLSLHLLLNSGFVVGFDGLHLQSLHNLSLNRVSSGLGFLQDGGGHVDHAGGEPVVLLLLLDLSFLGALLVSELDLLLLFVNLQLGLDGSLSGFDSIFGIFDGDLLQSFDGLELLHLGDLLLLTLGLHLLDGMGFSLNSNFLGNHGLFDENLLLHRRFGLLDGNLSFVGSDLGGNSNLNSLHNLLLGDSHMSFFVDHRFLGSLLGSNSLGFSNSDIFHLFGMSSGLFGSSDFLSMSFLNSKFSLEGLGFG
jgi:hypothetical protein